MYVPLAANTSTTTEGTVGTSIPVSVLNTTAVIGEYGARRLSENTNKNLAVRFFRPFIYSRTVNQPTKAKYILYKQYVMV